MKNTEAAERFDQANSSRINQLFWIAGSLENSDMKSMINHDVSPDFLEKLFPDVAPEHIQEYLDDNDVLTLFMDENKFGFIAEIHIPECSNFSYNKNGDPKYWTVQPAICYIEHVYAETPEELLAETEKVAKTVFQKYLKRDRTSKEKKQTK